MARKTTRRVAASKRKKSPAAKGRKSSAAKRASGAKRTARSASAAQHKTVSVESFVRTVRTLHDRGLLTPFLQSAKSAGLTLTMDAAAVERVKDAVSPAKKPVASSAVLAPHGLATAAAKPPPPPAEDPFDFGSDAAARGGLGRIKPLDGEDPFDF
jgi:hypothetical protein